MVFNERECFKGDRSQGSFDGWFLPGGSELEETIAENDDLLNERDNASNHYEEEEVAADVSGVPEVAHNENPGQAAAAGTQMRLRDRSTLKAPSKYVVNIAIFRPPVTFQEATSGPDANNWRKAIDNELKQHEKNKTWEFVPKRQG